MSAKHPSFRIGLQARVLIVVVTFLILLPAVTVWVVSSHLQQQMEDEASRTLANAEDVFLNSLENRLVNYSEHYKSVAGEARFGITAKLANNRQTIEKQLEDLQNNSAVDHEVFLFHGTDGGLLASRSTGVDPEKFDAASAAATKTALRAGIGKATIGVNDQAFSVVAVPIPDPDGPGVVGALTVGIRITEAAIRDLKLPPDTEVFLVLDGKVIVATRPGTPLPQGLIADVAQPGKPPEPTVVHNQHFLAHSGQIGTGAAGIHYVMLSSDEQQLRALENTRRTLLTLSIVGIVVSALIVAWFVRRVTQPLRELRDSAEAVGRGDFSRKIGRFSQDECGDLAEAFNGMTSNLQSSRAELEKAVQTLKNTQTQLIQSEKLSAVGQFVAGVAHELNNPLTAVIGFSELLRETASDTTIRPHLDVIAKSAHRCHKIVQNLLGFARQHPPERRLVKLNDTIDEVLEIMTYDLRTSNIRVVKELQEDLPAIMADPHQLQQVFVNILSNARQAIQAFRSDGEIVIRSRADGPRIRLEFQDNGPGIQPEHLSRIFDPFFTTKAVGKGTGLGMSLSYGIVHEHGGEIRVQSEAGRGATFVIELPVAVGGAGIGGSIESVIRANSRPPMAAGKWILVVDDEEWILGLSRALLEKDGYTVETAASGEKAIECLENRKFDVIVCDWKMPGLNGIQLYEHLCTTNLLAASRMIFMTGDVISDTFQQFLRRHAKTCISKPFAIGEFRSAVAGIVTAARE